MPLHTTRQAGLIVTAAIYNEDASLSDTNVIAVANASRVQGFVGESTPAALTTAFDMRADTIVLESDGSLIPVVRHQASMLTCNVLLAGPVANGRDQAAVFTSGQWINYFFIWNGTTLATIASTALTPVLPTGYTNWAYGTTQRRGTSGLIPSHAVGALMHYDLDETAGFAPRVVNSGQASSFTTISFSSYMPPNSRRVLIHAFLSYNNSTALLLQLCLRMPGGTGTFGNVVARAVNQAGLPIEAGNTTEIIVSSTQQWQYRLANGVPNLGGGAIIDVMGYHVPNGDG